MQSFSTNHSIALISCVCAVCAQSVLILLRLLSLSLSQGYAIFLITVTMTTYRKQLSLMTTRWNALFYEPSLTRMRRNEEILLLQTWWTSDISFLLHYVIVQKMYVTLIFLLCTNCTLLFRVDRLIIVLGTLNFLRRYIFLYSCRGIHVSIQSRNLISGYFNVT